MSEEDMWLAAYEHWWRETGNPLHVWDAIGRCVGCGEPVPEWCLRYLAETSRNLKDLTWRVLDGELPADKALKQAPKALGLGQQGKNAFAAAIEEREKGQDALDNRFYPVADEVAARRNISPESARRRVREGQRLLRLPRASKPL